MTAYHHIVIIISLAILISYVNYRFIKMQPTLAIMMTSLFLSMALIVLSHLGFPAIHHDVLRFVNRLHFHDVLMNCMLGLLLFAGALTIDVPHIKQQKWEILLLSTVTVVFSALLIGFVLFYALSFLRIPLTLTECFLFGALISPTDPISVLATFKDSKAPKKLEILIAAESLFNDGVGVVLFSLLYQLAFTHTHASLYTVSALFIQQSFGGIGFGLLLGILSYILMKPVQDHKIEILFTIALVMGGYSMAQILGISGPLTMVAAGIFIANHKHIIFSSEHTREHLETFWELIDELLNAILFLLIGAEILLVNFSYWIVIAAIITIPVVLAVRYITVAAPMFFFRFTRNYPSYTTRILTWGGLRGGLAVALALALPEGHTQNILLPMTYLVVTFSILVQGTTLKKLIKRSKKKVALS